jgi:hypothetical protein
MVLCKVCSKKDEVDQFFVRGGEDVLDLVRNMADLKEKVDPANDLDGCKWHRRFDTPKCDVWVEVAEKIFRHNEEEKLGG